MLNKNGERELAYVVHIDNIIPIEGADRVEQAIVGGWHIMVRKGQFQIGDLAIYFEIDSKVPEKPEFEFLAAKHYKVKTQKYFKGTVISQGLLMSAEDFGWENTTGGQFADDAPIIKRPDGSYLIEGDFLTKELGVTYAEAEDNKRKANSADKYKKMAQRRPNIFKKKWAQWMMRRNWGKKVMFFFFGKKKDKKGSWPSWVKKTDEERIQNMTWILEDKTPWYATEKIDGTSTTFTMKGFGRKREFYICSRNVVFDKPDKVCFYDTNVYLEMAAKYNIEKVLADLLNTFKDVFEYVTIQGETYGAGIQKRDYGIDYHDFMAFNLIVGYKDGRVKRYNPKEMTIMLSKYNIPCVPIVSQEFILPDSVEELLDIATDKSAIDGGMREGLVFRSADGVQSFKAVSNEFLLKYHN